MPLRIAIVGLGFGRDFVPIYAAHPDVAEVIVCDPDEARLREIADKHDVARRLTRLDDVLADDTIDAVHLFTPVPLHVEHTLAVLAAGKHCACAVVMATELDGLKRVVDAERRAKKNYMMMETAVYTREFLFVRDMLARGEMGALTFLRGTYFQDLEGNYPAYWRAQPPMHYATHAIAPLLALAGTRAEKVSCFGSGRLRADIQQPGGNVFPLQTAIFQLAGTNIAAEVTRSWFQTARPYTEAFTAYGDAKGFEWPQLEEEHPLVFTLGAMNPEHRGRPIKAERIAMPDRPDLLPPEFAAFIHGGHGGSHPHLVYEFIRSIVEERPSAIDAVTAANWCAAGICADLSAKQGGALVEIPKFSDRGAAS